MRVIIYGVGAIGGVAGGYLAHAGSEVILIGRPAQVDAIKQNGLRLITPTETHILKIAAVTAPEQVDFRPDDVVFLSVKSQDTEAALRSLKTVVKDVPIFCFQNGVRNEETAARYFPRIYGVKVQIGGIFVKTGEVTSRTTPAGTPIMGHYPSGTDALLEKVAETMRKAGFRVKVTPDIMPYKWGQLVGNLANAVSAITDSREEESRDVIEAVRQEASKLLKEAGIRWISPAEIAREWPEGADIKHSFDTRYQNSTWQSLTRKQGTVETEYFNGEIVRLAQRLGKKAPLNEALLGMVKEMAVKREVPGKYSLAQLRHMLGLNAGK